MRCRHAFLIGLVAVLALFHPEHARARAMLTYVFDDGIASVARHGFPLLEERGQKATAALVARRLGAGDPAYMTVDEARKLAAAGWEIASHGLTHRRPVDIPETFGEEVLGAWAPVAGRPGILQRSLRWPVVSLLMVEGKELAERHDFASMARDPGTWYFDRVLTQLYVHPAAKPKGRPPEVRVGSYERELRQSREELEALGFTVTSYVRPYNYWTRLSYELSIPLYAAAATGEGRPNLRQGFDPHDIHRFIIHTVTAASEVIAALKEAQKRDGWVVLCLHGVEEDVGYEPWPAATLAEVADWANANGVDVVTLAEGARRMQGK